MTGNKEPAYVVGIGASAGGLESLQKLFKSLPDNLGMSYVVVQHLSPDFESMMDELLAKHTAMSISKVSDGMLLAPDQVYLIPPGKDMVVQAGRLRLSDRVRAQGLGRVLTEEAFRTALALGAEKMIAQMTLDQQGAIEMFRRLGFEAEALLKEHVKDRDGRKYDLVLMSHDVAAFSARAAALGLGAPLDD